MLKSTASNIETKVEPFSLSWQPVGLCGKFTKKAISARVPPTSGVYGLFNSECQIFIGESANIQESLLHHAKETEFPSRYLQPTGFAFETCAEQWRESIAAKLIERFRPVLQNDVALIENSSPSNHPAPAPLDSGDSQRNPDGQAFSSQDHFNAQRMSRGSHFTRTQRVVFSSILVASVVIVFCPEVTGVRIFQSPSYQAAAIPLTPVSFTESTSDAADVDRTSQKSSIKNPSTAPSQNDGRNPVGTDTPDSSVKVKSPAQHVDKSDSITEQKQVSKVSEKAGNSKQTAKTWSVQISAAPTNDIAEALIQQLKDKGYDGHVVQSVVKGQTYYRIRVGHFDIKEKAESLRLALAQRAGYRDAYLTHD